MRETRYYIGEPGKETSNVKKSSVQEDSNPSIAAYPRNSPVLKKITVSNTLIVTYILHHSGDVSCNTYSVRGTDN